MVNEPSAFELLRFDCTCTTTDLINYLLFYVRSKMNNILDICSDYMIQNHYRLKYSSVFLSNVYEVRLRSSRPEKLRLNKLKRNPFANFILLNIFSSKNKSSKVLMSA